MGKTILLNVQNHDSNSPLLFARVVAIKSKNRQMRREYSNTGQIIDVNSLLGVQSQLTHILLYPKIYNIYLYIIQMRKMEQNKEQFQNYFITRLQLVSTYIFEMALLDIKSFAWEETQCRIVPFVWRTSTSIRRSFQENWFNQILVHHHRKETK